MRPERVSPCSRILPSSRGWVIWQDLAYFRTVTIIKRMSARILQGPREKNSHAITRGRAELLAFVSFEWNIQSERWCIWQVGWLKISRLRTKFINKNKELRYYYTICFLRVQGIFYKGKFLVLYVSNNYRYQVTKSKIVLRSRTFNEQHAYSCRGDYTVLSNDLSRRWLDRQLFKII